MLRSSAPMSVEQRVIGLQLSSYSTAALTLSETVATIKSCPNMACSMTQHTLKMIFLHQILQINLAHITRAMRQKTCHFVMLHNASRITTLTCMVPLTFSSFFFKSPNKFKSNFKCFTRLPLILSYTYLNLNPVFLSPFLISSS